MLTRGAYFRSFGSMVPCLSTQGEICANSMPCCWSKPEKPKKRCRRPQRDPDPCWQTDYALLADRLIFQGRNPNWWFLSEHERVLRDLPFYERYSAFGALSEIAKFLKCERYDDVQEALIRRAQGWQECCPEVYGWCKPSRERKSLYVRRSLRVAKREIRVCRAGAKEIEFPSLAPFVEIVRKGQSTLPWCLRYTEPMVTFASLLQRRRDEALVSEMLSYPLPQEFLDIVTVYILCETAETIMRKQ